MIFYRNKADGNYEPLVYTYYKLRMSLKLTQ